VTANIPVGCTSDLHTPIADKGQFFIFIPIVYVYHAGGVTIVLPKGHVRAVCWSDRHSGGAVVPLAISVVLLAVTIIKRQDATRLLRVFGGYRRNWGELEELQGLLGGIRVIFR